MLVDPIENQNYLQKELLTLLKEDDSIFDFIQSSSLDVGIGTCKIPKKRGWVLDFGQH